MSCEDYPCCGHGEEGCNWVSPNDNPDLYLCDQHEDYEGNIIPVWHPIKTQCPLWQEDEEDE